MARLQKNKRESRTTRFARPASNPPLTRLPRHRSNRRGTARDRPFGPGAAKAEVTRRGRQRVLSSSEPAGTQPAGSAQQVVSDLVLQVETSCCEIVCHPAPAPFPGSTFGWSSYRRLPHPRGCTGQMAFEAPSGPRFALEFSQIPRYLRPAAYARPVLTFLLVQAWLFRLSAARSAAVQIASPVAGLGPAVSLGN
jgi:hypothetical protein